VKLNFSLFFLAAFMKYVPVLPILITEHWRI
jgi:hypothetical protein